MTAVSVHRGIVKQVLSGDSIVIRGLPMGGPPPEKTVYLSNIQAPKLARRGNPNVSDSSNIKDEPFAWEAREFLRNKLVSNEVAFYEDFTDRGSGRHYGVVFLGNDDTGENMTEELIKEGLVDVRHSNMRKDDPKQQQLIQLESLAMAEGKGRHGADANTHVRDVHWVVENSRNFVDSHHGNPIDAVVERVRDGCTVMVFLLPTFHYVTIMLSGIKCPMFPLRQTTVEPAVVDPFAEECRYFTERRILQRSVQVVLEGVSNQVLLGTITMTQGNIAEALLAAGFARCVDWSMSIVTQGAESLRAAEKKAKEARLKMWKDYTAPAAVDPTDKAYVGKVVEVVNGDSVVVKLADGTTQKIFLSSIRPPSRVTTEEDTGGKDSSRRVRLLYDVPYMFEAREFLRKKLIGKKVTVTVDYVQPAYRDYAMRTCCTVMAGNINIAEALVSKGLARVVRYRQDDDNRSTHYDQLLAAEARAEKKGVGLFSKEDAPIHRVSDLSGDVTKSKQFLPFLKRVDRSKAVVEFVTSGSRLRLYIPRETCLITFLLSGIECPRAGRQMGPACGGDPFSEDALRFTKEMCLQKEVDVEVESMDKRGSFIGWLYVDEVNLSVALVEAGLSKVHFSAELSSHFSDLQEAEKLAKAKRINVWSVHVELKQVEVVEEPVERKLEHVAIRITEVTDRFTFFAQNVNDESVLEGMAGEMRREMETNPPLLGACVPKCGDMCAAKYSADNLWYRARVLKVEPNRQCSVLFVDYGNEETVGLSSIATLPSAFLQTRACAKEYALAAVRLPPDADGVHDAVDKLCELKDRQLDMNVEYLSSGLQHVTLRRVDGAGKAVDVGLSMLTDGLVMSERRREKRLVKLVRGYQAAEQKAKDSHVNIWRYGDFTEDDSPEEIGLSR